MITIYIIRDNVHDETLAATLSKIAAVSFIENFMRMWSGCTEEEIAEEIKNILDDDYYEDTDYEIEEVPYTDGTYELTDGCKATFVDPEEEKKLRAKYDKGL